MINIKSITDYLYGKKSISENIWQKITYLTIIWDFMKKSKKKISVPKKFKRNRKVSNGFY